MTTREIYVVAAARTAIGTFGGALRDVPLTQLATTAVREALKRSGAEAATTAAPASATAAAWPRPTRASPRWATSTS